MVGTLPPSLAVLRRTRSLCPPRNLHRGITDLLDGSGRCDPTRPQSKRPAIISRASASSAFGFAAQRASPTVTGAAVAVFTFTRALRMLACFEEAAEGATCDSWALVAPNREACTGEIGNPFT